MDITDAEIERLRMQARGCTNELLLQLWSSPNRGIQLLAIEERGRRRRARNASRARVLNMAVRPIIPTHGAVAAPAPASPPPPAKRKPVAPLIETYDGKRLYEERKTNQARFDAMVVANRARWRIGGLKRATLVRSISQSLGKPYDKARELEHAQAFDAGAAIVDQVAAERVHKIAAQLRDAGWVAE